MILASKSPRRKEILEGFGIELEILTSSIEETSDKDGLLEQIMDISRKKSLDISEKRKKSYVVSADTVVVLEGKILGKPKDEDEAFYMLNSLSGKQHKVLTAYTLMNSEKKIDFTSYDTTEVFFKELSEEEIRWYISTGEPMDKAGAYGIQGKGSVLVKKIEGDFFNVMGFPISKFYDDLKDLDLSIDELNKTIEVEEC
ncbi:Maf family protein [Ilyobacter polytropus]|uniref:dTTP/UTP pyrophosphatase n=1 Tax=Ilyobacter polytropus (strain ATCC 51220 / DSM 2926 / LMG 16218 / CuHBu1) TaxID=572544 RepID=E3H6F9_ILYPC|nr:Maf family protein [Ilyobacter polytropus]ADO82372.1 maf protein [Ilyobacter polytropus DSM 2926]